jgi:predicted enzyme related to lactoylglutathione lyase
VGWPPAPARRGVISHLELLINIDVNDLEKAVRFYCSAFGLTVGRRFGDSGMELQGPSIHIYLLHKAEGSPVSRTIEQVRRYARHWTPVHLDFVVDEIESAVQRAVSAGAALEEPISVHDWGKLALMADPFGHGFCLVQFLGRGYDELAEASLSPT